MAVTPIPITNGMVMEVRNKQIMYGQTILTTLHYRCDVTSSGGTILSVANGLDTLLRSATGFAGRLNAFQTEELTQDSSDYQIVFPIRYIAVNLVGLGTGAVAADNDPPLPQNSAVTINRKPQIAKKGVRSTLHLTGIPGTMAAQGLITTNCATLLGNIAAASIVTQAVQGGITLVPIVYSRATPNASLELATYTIGAQIRTMRRRTAGVGI